MELSKLHICSIGVVAKNKSLKSRVIEVTPIEATPMANGELTDNTVSYKASAVDTQGSAYQVEVPTTNTVKATWLPMHSSNRVTAPDVRRGELVVLYRFADTDDFWWATLKDDLELRKLETVIYAFSGTREESAKPSAENTYFLEISTHNKLVHFHTSKADGEPFIYDIQINTKDGNITIRDDAGNYFSFDSKERQLELKNVDGTHIDLNKKDLTITVPETYTLQAKNVVERIGESLDHTSDSIRIETGSINENAGGGDIVVSGISHTGHVHGGVEVGGGDTQGPQ